MNEDESTIVGKLSENSGGVLDQVHAWQEQISILKSFLNQYSGRIFFEFEIPRMGKRVDTILLIENVIFVLEFKVGEKKYNSSDLMQTWDYVLDLKNFHEKSEFPLVVPILVATDAVDVEIAIDPTIYNDNTIKPIKANSYSLQKAINTVLGWNPSIEKLDIDNWEKGRYFPTPTIIEKASNLYCGNTVEGLAEKTSDEKSFTNTTNTISEIIERTRGNNEKAICFLTGVPGAGKTLVGLEIAAKHLNADRRESSVYLSGNGPLVKVLQEALAIDHIEAEKLNNRKITKNYARSQVKVFIQNVHHFRDACLIDEHPQPEHVAIFDEAQRAWNLKQTIDFMRRKKNRPNFSVSEPEFLISCMNRHDDWAVVLCLVGGGQEINTGEAGISEWIESINRSFQNWNVYISEKLEDTEYAAGNALAMFQKQNNLKKLKDLHLSVSMRSFRAETVSEFVKRLLDLDIEIAKNLYDNFYSKYPIVLTRDIHKAKRWLKDMARGSQKYGIVTSSKAQRLKPLAIDVRYETNPVHWFLHGKDDVRSSYYLEDVATEFQVQGLELDWVCHVWDADFRYSSEGWIHKNFRGKKWINIKKLELQTYQKNAYRVLLTRARQGMIICIPKGDGEDLTRKPEYYDSTYNYLKAIGIREV
ncbi:MAG: DUF2075 domain-containing protein [Candidatus Marinimicrobia bacterium]|nr:DUF2075 domain-containing protein [Candidatus Neomarinimicrobiota bacterium]